MNRTFLLFLIAMSGLVFLTMAGATPAVAGPDGSASGQEPDSPQATAPHETTPDTQAPPDWKCPNCGADSPMRYGRRGESGMRGHAGRNGHGGKHEHGAPSSFGGMGRAPRQNRGNGLPVDRILRGATRLELTEDQITNLEKLSYDTRMQLIDLESDLEKAQLEMKRLMEGDSDDSSAVKKQLRSLSEKKLGIQEVKLDNWFKAKKLLTDDQKQKIRTTHRHMGGML